MEKTFWLFVGIIILSFLTYLILYTITLNELIDIIPAIYFGVFCFKDDNGNYFIAKETDLEFCEKIKGVSEDLKIECGFFYEDQTKLQLCKETQSIFYKRLQDCIDFTFNGIKITSVKNREIQEICEKLKN